MIGRQRLQQIAGALGGGEPPQGSFSLDSFLPLLERMRTDGAVVVVKLDGQRVGEGDAPPYTVIVSAPFITGGFYRADSHSLEEALTSVVAEYAAGIWKV